MPHLIPAIPQAFGESAEHYQVAVRGDKVGHGAFVGKIHVCLVYCHHPVEILHYAEYLLSGECIAGRIVGTADPDDFSVGVRCLQYAFHRKGEIGIQAYFPDLYVVDIGRHFVDSITRGNRHHVVYPRATEYPYCHVDCLVAARSPRKIDSAGTLKATKSLFSGDFW